MASTSDKTVSSKDREKEIKRALNKLNVSALEEIWENIRPKRNVKKKTAVRKPTTRKSFIDDILDNIVKNHNTDKHLGILCEMELKVLQLCEKACQWIVCKLHPEKDDDCVIDPTLLETKLRKQLSERYNTCVKVDVYNEIVWLNIHLEELKRTRGRRPEHVVHLIFKPDSPYLLHVKFKNRQVESFVMEIILVLLGYHEIETLDLRDIHPLDLINFAERKDNPELRFENGPTVSKQRKRNVPNEEISEDVVSHQARLQYSNNVFGTADQPKLTVLNFHTETRYRGRSRRGQENTSDIEPQPFICNVQFRGPDVLCGLQQLVENGMTNQKLPSHMANVPVSGQNYIVLEERSHRKKR